MDRNNVRLFNDCTTVRLSIHDVECISVGQEHLAPSPPSTRINGYIIQPFLQFSGLANSFVAL